MTKMSMKSATGADSVGKNKNGEYVFRREFFYTHGFTSEKWAAKVSAALTADGRAHRVTEHHEVWKPFRGGASTAQSSHWAAHVKFVN